MNKIISIRSCAFIGCLLMVAALASCKKGDENPNNGKPILYSFGPTGSKIGDTLRFIGLNLNQVNAIQFTGEGAKVEKNNFISQSAELIRLIVPASAEKGFVTLQLINGDTITTKTQLNLSILISISAITPVARPGDPITIEGNYLNWIDRITFRKDKVVPDFIQQSQNQLQVIVPEDAQTGTLTVHFTGTDSSDIETSDTLHVILPMATSFSPNPVKHGTNVTINGTNLDLAKKVYFTGASSPLTSFISQTATQLVVKVPEEGTTGKITLEAASGVSTTSAVDLAMVMPAITGISPNPVNTEQNITITGTNLDVVSSVAFVGVSDPVSTFVNQTATQLIVKVPKGTVTGQVTLNIKNSILSVKSDQNLSILGSSLPPIIIYDDAVTSAWNGWVGGGWGGTVDYNNTSPVRSGSKSIKINYTSGGWGAPLQLGGADVTLAGYTKFRLSVYGGTDADGKTIKIVFNAKDGVVLTVQGGKWTDVEIPVSDLTAASKLTEIWVQNSTEIGDYTIYVDNIGIY